MDVYVLVVREFCIGGTRGHEVGDVRISPGCGNVRADHESAEDVPTILRAAINILTVMCH